MSNKTNFFKASKTRTTTYPVGDGVEFRVRSLTERERSEYEIAMLDETGEISKDALKEQRKRLIAICVMNDDGTQMFDSSNLTELDSIDGGFAGELYDFLLKFCKLREDVKKESNTQSSSDTTRKN